MAFITAYNCYNSKIKLEITAPAALPERNSLTIGY
jgi:hypothetical protein